MGSVPLLDELAIIAAIAVAVTVILARLKLPTVAGVLAAGAIMGPYGFGLVKEIHAIEVLAEIGVVLLLFSIGLEFSLSRLSNIMRQVALGGVLQVGLTGGAVAGVTWFLGEPPGRAIFYGFVFALSSTAIVLRALGERRELDAPHGRFIVGTLIFQDLCVVPMVIVVPMLGAASVGNPFASVGLAMGKAVLVVVGAIIGARLVVPRVLKWVDASRSREVFLLAILALCIGTAWLTSLAGLSLALGAFLGGMLVADTEYGHRAMGDILPLRDAFVSIFFVSLGMLFDPQIVLQKPILVLVLFLGFVVAKGVIATLAAMAMRFPARAAWLAGVGLAQFGEFGFVLARLGQQHGIVDDEAMRPLLTAGISSMFVTPLFVRIAPHITAGERILAPLERLIGVSSIDDCDQREEVELHDHVVVIGFGVAGGFAARSLEACGIPFVVMDLNAENVKRGKDQGLPVYYGDATSEEALNHAHLADARLLVLLMNDPAAAERVVDTVKRVAPTIPILMRTRYLLERPNLVRLGASDVVAEEVEGAVEVVSRMLRRIDIPRNVIDESLHAFRLRTQTTERRQSVPRNRLVDTHGLDELKIESALVRDGCKVVGASLVGLKLRSVTGALVVGIRKHDVLQQDIDPNTTFDAGDVVYFVGTTDAVERAVALVSEMA